MQVNGEGRGTEGAGGAESAGWREAATGTGRVRWKKHEKGRERLALGVGMGGARGAGWRRHRRPQHGAKVTGDERAPKTPSAAKDMEDAKTWTVRREKGRRDLEEETALLGVHFDCHAVNALLLSTAHPGHDHLS